MMKIRAVVAVAAVTAAAAVLLHQTQADAHHPEVDVACLSAPATIRITSVAWDAPTLDERINDNIQVTFDGVVIGVGAFNPANNYSFTLDYAAPAVRGTHVVRATSLHPWGSLEDDPDPIGVGEFREATIVLPCGTSVVTTTTVAPPAIVPTTTTTTVEVLGVSDTRPDVATPVAVNPRFAG